MKLLGERESVERYVLAFATGVTARPAARCSLSSDFVGGGLA
jgi:hypothetical protein